jgi:hypothetical protein
MNSVKGEKCRHDTVVPLLDYYGGTISIAGSQRRQQISQQPHARETKIKI